MNLLDLLSLISTFGVVGGLVFAGWQGAGGVTNPERRPRHLCSGDQGRSNQRHAIDGAGPITYPL